MVVNNGIHEVGSGNGNEGVTSSSGKSPQSSDITRLIVVGCVVACMFLVVGFFRFASAYEQTPGANDRIADAIVVLTGGTARVQTGLHSLQNAVASGFSSVA